MVSCSSCNTANPDGAKFCVHCGKPLPAAAASPRQPAAAQPPAPVRAPEAPAEPVRPLPITGKQAFQPKSAHAPVPSEPDPSAPGQTQFFVAAAGVSTGSKVKRVVFFFIGAIIIGLVIFFGLKFALKAGNESLVKRVPTETTETQPTGQPGEPAAPAAGTPSKAE
jgi:hypothetical protein